VKTINSMTIKLENGIPSIIMQAEDGAEFQYVLADTLELAKDANTRAGVRVTLSGLLFMCPQEKTGKAELTLLSDLPQDYKYSCADTLVDA
jgi:hypothetical protein